MANLNTAQQRVVDPILSTVAQGYKDAELVGDALFPQVPVNVRGGRIIEFGIEDFRRYNIRRAPGGAMKRIRFGHEGKPFTLDQDAIEGQVPFEHLQDAAAVPGIDLATRAVRGTMKIIMRAKEIEQAEIARNADNYDNDHKVDLAAAQWSNDDNDPTKDIDTGREAIVDTIGIEPNTLLLSRRAFRGAKNNAKIIERIKYTTRDSVTTAILSELFDLDRVVVGGGFYMDDDGAPQQIWGADAVLAYVPTEALSMEEPSYGYTYTYQGHPLVLEAYQDRPHQSWMYPTLMDRAPVLAGMNAGYLLQNCA